MLRFLRNIGIYSAIIVVCAIVLDQLFTHVHSKGDLVRSQWAMQMNDRHFDLIVLGSSRAWWNLDMNMVQEQCSIKAIDLANNHFTPSEMLLSLKIFLANGNKADRALMQVDYRTVQESQRERSSTAQEFIPYLQDPIVGDHLAEQDREWQVLRTVPFVRYVRYNFRWGPEQLITTVLDLRRPLFDGTGSYLVDAPYREDDEKIYDMIDLEFPAELREIQEMCRKNDIDLQLFMAPYHELKVMSETRRKFEETVSGTGLPFHDFSDSLQDRSNFIDPLHLNIKGGKLLTQYLIEQAICPAGS